MGNNMKALHRHFGQNSDAEAAAPAPTATPEPPARGIKRIPRDPLVQMRRAPVLPGRKAQVEVLTLTLGEFLDRIPAEFLEERVHDRATPLAFELSFLSDYIWRCETQIPLTEIFQRA